MKLKVYRCYDKPLPLGSRTQSRRWWLLDLVYPLIGTGLIIVAIVVESLISVKF